MNVGVGWFGLSRHTHHEKHVGAFISQVEQGDLAGVQAALAREIERGMTARDVVNNRAGETVR